MEIKDETKKTETPPETAPAQPDPAILEFQAAMKVKDEEIARLRSDFEAQKNTAERKEIDTFCDALVVHFGVKPAVVSEDVRAQLMALNNTQVLEFADGDKKTQRAFWLDYLADLLPTSARVPVGAFAAQAVNQPAPPKTAEEEIDMFAAQAKELLPNGDPRDLYLKQVELWTAAKGGR